LKLATSALLGILLGIVCGGCSSLRVATDYDHAIDFTKYHTYRWAPTRVAESESLRADHSLLEARIKRAVDRELAARGFERRSEGPTDLIVVFYASRQHRVEVYPSYGYPRHWRTAHAYHYREGTIVLDFVDTRLDQMVWRGWATEVLGDPEDAEERINEAIAKILERFPPSGSAGAL
jgi:hypothetical protein